MGRYAHQDDTSWTQRLSLGQLVPADHTLYHVVGQYSTYMGGYAHQDDTSQEHGTKFSQPVPHVHW